MNAKKSSFFDKYSRTEVSGEKHGFQGQPAADAADAAGTDGEVSAAERRIVRADIGKGR